MSCFDQFPKQLQASQASGGNRFSHRLLATHEVALETDRKNTTQIGGGRSVLSVFDQFPNQWQASQAMLTFALLCLASPLCLLRSAFLTFDHWGNLPGRHLGEPAGAASGGTCRGDTNCLVCFTLLGFAYVALPCLA